MSHSHPIPPTQGDASDSPHSRNLMRDPETLLMVAMAVVLAVLFCLLGIVASQFSQNASNVWLAGSLYRDRLQATESMAHFQARQHEHVVHVDLAADLSEHNKKIKWANYDPDKNEIEIDFPTGINPAIPIGFFFFNAEIQAANVVDTQPSVKGVVKLPDQVNAVDFLKKLAWRMTFVPVANDRTSASMENSKISVKAQLHRLDLVKPNGDVLWSQSFAPDRAASLACDVPEVSAWVSQRPSNTYFQWFVVGKSVNGNAFSRKISSGVSNGILFDEGALTSWNWSESRVRLVTKIDGTLEHKILEYDCKASALVVDGVPYVRTFDKKAVSNLL